MSSQQIECTGANGVCLAADAFGDPSHPHVLLLHGGGQTRHSWGGTAEVLALNGFYAVSADLRGHGGSSWDPGGDYGMEAMRQDLEAWCEVLERPVVVGASLGGMTGIYTEVCRALDGLEPLCRALVMVDIAHRTEIEGVERIVGFMTASPDGFASLEEAADAVAVYLPYRPRPKNLDGLARNLRVTADGRYHWHWDPAFMANATRARATSNPNFVSENAHLLNLPVLLVRGRLSDVLSEKLAQEFLEIVVHAEYVDVQDAHHMVAGDRNDAFTGPVVDFLKRLPAH